jgi:membrane-associated phospholipid phosphatase
MTDAARFFADSLNPLLIICLAGTGFASRARFPIFKYWAACVLGIGAAVILAESGKYFVVWPGHPSFPSGHESFAISASVGLAAADRRWLWAVIPICLLMAWSLVSAGYHHPIDVAGAAIIAPWPPLAVFRFLRRRSSTSL